MSKWRFIQGVLMVVCMLVAGTCTADAARARVPQLAAGADFTVVLRSDGTLRASGGNELGQLGDGTTLQRNSPVQAGLPDNGSGWAAVAAGLEHTLALKADGTLWAWGANDFGQLGIGTVYAPLVATRSPVQVGSDHDWVAVAAGDSCSVALKADGTLWAWGLNNFGQLGNGDASGALRSSPVEVLNPGSSAYVAVSVSNQHVLALQADGTLWSWGSNQFGQLGLSTVDLTTHATPVQVVTGDPALDRGWKAVSAGGWHSLAQQSDGSLWGWGRNSLGQLGNGSASANNLPQPVSAGPDRDWAGFAAGYLHSAAFKRDGTLWTWGANSTGQLGIGGAVDLLRHSTPLQITEPSGFGSIIALAAGTGHTLAARANGDLYVWGDNRSGQLGTGAGVNNLPVSATLPQAATGDATGWLALEPGGRHTAGLRSNGTLWVWGDNAGGQAGLDPITSPGITVPARMGTADSWSALAGGASHTIALRADGTLWSWGGNAFGQLGDGSDSDRFSPQQITLTAPQSPDNRWTAVAAGDGHTLALQADGSLWAWGDNSSGQLGVGTTGSHFVPERITTTQPGRFDDNWVAIAAGGLYSAALQADGTLWVWGDNGFGQFGADPLTTTGSATPLRIVNSVPVPGNPGFNSNWAAIAAGYNHLLALQADGTLWGLGANEAGQLGNGSGSVSSFAFMPVQNSGLPPVPYTAVAAGDSHSVALRADGTIWSWGSNTSGQLGIGIIDPDPENPPVHATPLQESSSASNWVAISCGGRHTVAIKADGTLAFWGSNQYGQLGDATTDPRSEPAPLLEPRASLPAAVAFDTIPLAGPYPARTVTVANTGTSPLQLTGITVTGTDSTSFIIQGSGSCQPADVLAPAASCTIDITFVPDSVGQRSATLSITSTDPVTPAAGVSLSGSGFIPFIITASAGANGSISPAGLVPVPATGSQLFTMVADPGAKIVDVVVDGISIGPVNSYLFNGVISDGHTISASFAALTFMDSWSFRNPLPTLHTLRRIAVNDSGIHVAVGDYGTILRSEDNGVSWMLIDNGGHTLNSVAFGNGTFVAVGSHGRILTSPDGSLWTPRHTGTGTELQGVAYGNGVFVAVGNTQTDPDTLVPIAPIYTSPDGIAWTPRLQVLPINTSMDLHAVAFGSDGGSHAIFVAAGQGGYLLTSADNGVTWFLNGTLPINPAEALPAGIGFMDFYDIHFAAGSFVAVGASGQVYRSGVTANAWTRHDILSFADLKGVTYNTSRFVAVGTSGEIWDSGDGTAWSQQTSGLESTQLSINGITRAASGFLAAGQDGLILASSDGSAWSVPHPRTETAAVLRDVIHANGIYTAVGSREPTGTAAILTSRDGVAWSRPAASPAVNGLRGLAFGSGLLVAVGESGFDQSNDPASRPEILISSDNGQSWTRRLPVTSPATSLNLYGIAYGGGLFVAVGDWDIDTFDAVILTSTDGIAWTRRSNPSPDTLHRITYVNGQFVAVGGAGTVLVSGDGVTWTNHSISFGPEFSAVAVKPGTPAILAAVGTNSTRVYRSSDDGATWSSAPHVPASLPTGVLRGISHAAGQFVAVGESGFIFSSPDAVSWTTRMGADIHPFGTRDLMAVTFGNGRFLAVGSGGAIIQSSADAVSAALPVLSLAPSALSLEAAEIGTTVDTLFTVTNRGGSGLVVAGVEVAPNPAFEVLSSDCTALQPDQSCSFTVRYSPGHPSGSATQAALSVASDDPASPMLTALRGTSIDTTAPELAITQVPAFFTNSTTIQISGTVEPGAAMAVEADTAATAGPVIFSGEGGMLWNCTISNLASGINIISVTATDAADNSTVRSASVTYDAVPFVRRFSDSSTGSLIQPLYSTAADIDVIQVRAVAITETLLFERPEVTLTLDGGYDSGFSTPSGDMSFINGSMVIRAGTVRARRITIR